MMLGMRVRGALLAALIMVAVPMAGALVSVPAAAQTVASIAVEGNRRVEVETIRSYFKPGPGGRLGQAQIDDGLKALIETGLFQDVRINQVGGRLVVTVVENAVIGRIAFEGNKKVKDEQLSAEIQSKPRGTFSRPMVQSDAQRIAEIYRRSGRYDVRVTPEIIEQPNNRVDLIFTVTEGSKTGVRSIEFVGNVAYSSYRLKDVIKTRESNLLSFLGGADVYDPDRVEADRDLIRRFYLKNGYADVQVIAALTEYDPDKKGFLVTFKIEEGQQYRVATVDFQTSIATLDTASMRSFSRVSVGSVYNAEALEKSVEEMQIEASRRGYAFAVVRPRGDRNFEAHTVSIVFAIDEGPRTYIERINVRGNTRTRDYVIRREFDLSEGDAYNRALVDRAERRLKNLDFFKSVKIVTEPGSSTDRVILVVDLEEKSTGDFSVSGGYSTTDGALAEVSISERNFLELVAARGEEQDRRLGARGAQAAEDLEAVHRGQLHVEHDQVRRLGGGVGQPLLARARDGDLVPLLLEGELDASRDGVLVFDDQDGGHGVAILHGPADGPSNRVRASACGSLADDTSRTRAWTPAAFRGAAPAPGPERPPTRRITSTWLPVPRSRPSAAP